MATTLLTIADITKEAVAVLHEELQLAKIANRKYEDRFGKKSGQIGTKVSIRKPPKYAVGTSADVSALSGESVEDYVDLNCTTRRNIKLVFSSLDLTMKINDFSKQFVRPAVARLAREIDLVGFAALKTAPQSRVTRTSTNAISFLDYALMNARLDSNLAPSNDRTLFATSVDHAYVVDGNKGLFQSSEAIKDQYLKGYMGTSGGFEWVACQSLPSITFGAVPATAGTAAALTEGAVPDPFNIEGIITLGGVAFGFMSGYAVWVKKYGQPKALGSAVKRFARYLVGIVGVIALYLGLKMIFPEEPLALGYLLRFVRYTLIGLWVTYFAPLVFKKLKLEK